MQLLPSHCVLDFSKRGKNLLIILSSPNNLQTDGHTGKFLRVILVIYKLIIIVLGYIVDILGVFGWINCCHRENCCWAIVLSVSDLSLRAIDLLVQKIPLSGVSPVT